MSLAINKQTKPKVMVFLVLNKWCVTYSHVCEGLMGTLVHLCPCGTPLGPHVGICLLWEQRVILCRAPIISPNKGCCWGYSVSINTKRRRMENSFGVTVLFCIISQAAGWGCCHGDAATEECRRGRRR